MNSDVILFSKWTPMKQSVVLQCWLLGCAHSIVQGIVFNHYGPEHNQYSSSSLQFWPLLIMVLFASKPFRVMHGYSSLVFSCKASPHFSTTAKFKYLSRTEFCSPGSYKLTVLKRVTWHLLSAWTEQASKCVVLKILLKVN